MTLLPLENPNTAYLKAQTTNRRHQEFLSCHIAISVMCGILLFDHLPAAVFLAIIVSASAACVLLRQNRHVSLGIMMLVSVAFGGLGSVIEAKRFQAPLLAEVIDGYFFADIVKLEPDDEGRQRLWLEKIRKSKKSTHYEVFGQVRIVADLQEAKKLRRGDTISGWMRLFPLSEPHFPDWPDYARKSWREGISATGYGRNVTYVHAKAYEAPTFMVSLREGISQRISSQIPKPERQLALALLIG